MPTVHGTAKLLALKATVEGLSPADRLRLAAGLIDRGKYEVAEVLVGNITDELRALRLLPKK